MTTASIQQAMLDLGVPSDDWDAVIVGDGSGTGWEKSCGWAAVLVDHWGGYRQEFYGSWSKGTSHIAELMPYLEALTWYVSGPGKTKRRDDGFPSPTPVRAKIHLVTDNVNIANCGNRHAERNSYSWLWEPFVHIENMGYILKWHWVERNRLALNRLSDFISRLCRIRIEALKLEIENQLETPMEELLYDFNPTENLDIQGAEP